MLGNYLRLALKDVLYKVITYLLERYTKSFALKILSVALSKRYKFDWYVSALLLDWFLYLSWI